MELLSKGGLSRRSVLLGTGALVVSFSVASALAQEAAPAAPAPVAEPVKLPGSLDDARLLDSWIRIDADGTVTVFTGKVEIGQGIRTALIQVAAEELEVDPAEINLITADTARTPDEGFTAGSQSMQNSGTAIRNAAAQVRDILIAEASRRFGVAPTELKAEGKAIHAADGRKVGYGELVAAELLHVEAQPKSNLKKPGTFKVMGQSLPRVDIPGKVTGGVAYVQDLRLEGMLHARVVRPPSPGATLRELDDSGAKGMPGVVAVVRDGNFLAVVAEREFQAVAAMHALTTAAKWDERAGLPDQAKMPEALQSLEREVGVVAEAGVPEAIPPAGSKVLEATFTRPYHLHGSIGPSCGVAVMNDEGLTVWSHTQGVYPDQEAIAEMLAMPAEKVRVIHMESAGCYGHNGADDAAADAALIAHHVPGRPVRVQWMREQEHAWEPFGPAMLMKVRAAVDRDGRIASWNYDLWSHNHSSRPGGAAALLAGQHKANGFPAKPGKLNISPSGNGDRNANPLYVLPNKRVNWHFLPDAPLRVSALRGLGAYANTFAIESFMDDLALAAETDPVEFRLRHLEDERARDVVQLAAEKFGWKDWKPAEGRGRGFAFSRYKNLAAYLAVGLEIEVDRETGRVRVVRAVTAIDSGEVVNPDGIRNQTEGGVLQTISWTLYEALTFDDTRVTSVDWASYPILRFPSAPDTVEVHIVDRPGKPFLGTGEAAQGPVGAAIGNAIRDLTGTRLYDLPLSRERVKQAFGV